MSLAKYDVMAFFKIAESKSLEYQRLLSIQNYKSSYKFYLREDIAPSKAFHKDIDILELDNQEVYTS